MASEFSEGRVLFSSAPLRLTHRVALLSSWDGHDQISQTGALKITDICCIPVLEARSLILRCWQFCAPSEDSRGACFIASSRFRWLLGIPCLGGYMNLPSLCVCVSTLFFNF